MKSKWAFAACVCCPLAALSACRQDMHNQPKYKPLAASDFFGDGRSSRPVIEDTVARGHLRLDEARFTGKINGRIVDAFPFTITRGGHPARPGAIQCVLLAVSWPRLAMGRG